MVSTKMWNSTTLQKNVKRHKKNSALITGINYMLKYILIEYILNRSFKLYNISTITVTISYLLLACTKILNCSLIACLSHANNSIQYYLFLCLVFLT